MKKILLLALIALSMSSCYTSKVYHGNITANTPQVEVASKQNPILLWGLLPLKNAEQKASDYVGDRANYTTKNTWEFVDGFLSVLTFGIYSPTTTKYYIPVEEVKK